MCPQACGTLLWGVAIGDQSAKIIEGIKTQDIQLITRPRRQAKPATPFGVGAMSVLVNGTSVITAAVDHWYEAGDGSDLAMEEYQEHDWRLESRLKVSEFRLPPDYRRRGQGSDQRNVRLTVPVLRFPRWSFS